MFYQALDFVKAGNDARSYIELMRYAQFFSALCSHNSFNSKQYQKDRNLNKKRLNNAITKLEELKPRLIKAYNDEIEKEKERLLNPSPSPPPSPPQNDTNSENLLPSAPKIEENEEKKEEKISTANRWNNLKIESS